MNLPQRKSVRILLNRNSICAPLPKVKFGPSCRRLIRAGINKLLNQKENIVNIKELRKLAQASLIYAGPR